MAPPVKPVNPLKKLNKIKNDFFPQNTDGDFFFQINLEYLVLDAAETLQWLNAWRHYINWPLGGVCIKTS